MAVTGFLSGVESGMHFGHCVRAGVKHVLMSFLQFKNHDKGIVRARKKKHPDMKFMVDSGAFTFITSWEKYTSWTREDFQKYVEEYVEWLDENREYIHTAVEYDIDHTLNMILGGSINSTIGGSIVEGWQRDLFRPLVEKGLEVVFVWHENRGIDGWEDMCRRYSYVGMPGHYSSDPEKVNRHFSVARRYLTKVHGFAATKQLDFRDVPWCSVDSITWKTGEMYGTLIVWDEGQQKLIFEENKAERFRYKHIIDKAGFNSASIISPNADYKELTRFCLWSMRQMEAFYARQYATRTPYFAVRLPHWKVVQKAKAPWLMETWARLRGDTIFKEHIQRPAAEVLNYLLALSAAQTGDLQYLAANKLGLDFLGAYFPKLTNPLVSDPTVLQKEVANYVIPPNPPPLLRTAAEHFLYAFPKAREDEINPDELSFNPYMDDMNV